MPLSASLLSLIQNQEYHKQKQIVDDHTCPRRHQSHIEKNRTEHRAQDTNAPHTDDIADKWHIEWKIRQINHVLSCDIVRYRECLEK